MRTKVHIARADPRVCAGLGFNKYNGSQDLLNATENI